MTISDHITEYYGLPVVQYASKTPLVNAEKTAYRLSIDWDAHNSGLTFEMLFAEFLKDSLHKQVQAIIIGDWGGTGEGNGADAVVEALVSARDELPNLKALYIGEMTAEESEISWINQTDISPVLEAFPLLEVLSIRGGTDLSLGNPSHPILSKLVIESGGLDSNVINEISQGDLPSLIHLELWLGDDNYGNTISPDDIKQLLESDTVSNLKYLGLKNDCHADETAKALSETSLPAGIETLDLSLGVLGDEGANALLQAPWLKQLKKLDLSRHFISPDVVEQLKVAVKELDASDPQTEEAYGGESYRYIAVSE